MGTSTAAIGLCHWLKSVGAAVCYVEADPAGHLTLLARSYGMEQEGDGWSFEGVQYRRDEPKTPVNFIISDMGSGKTPSQGTDILVLVCGTKPQELPFTAKLKRTQEGNHAYILCPFVLEDTKEDVAEALQDDYHKVLFLDYQPEPTDGSANAKPFKAMMTNYIAGV